MENKELSKEQIKERALFELEDIKKEEARNRDKALSYLKKITNEADKIKRGIEAPEFEAKNVQDDTILTWITQYTEYFKDHLKTANQLRRMQQDLEYTIKLVTEEAAN